MKQDEYMYHVLMQLEGRQVRRTHATYDLKECGTEEKIILKIVASYTCTIKSGY